MPLKIAVADNLPIVIAGIRYSLQRVRGVRIIFEADNGLDLIEKIKVKKPDIVLLDSLMPVMDGLSTAFYLHKNFPDIKIMVLTQSESITVLKKYLGFGVKGFISKNATVAEFRKSVLDVMDNDICLNGVTLDIVKGKPKSAKDKKARPDLKVTSQQQTILNLICSGNSNHEIGKKLNLSKRTIEHCRERLLQKFRVKNSAELVKEAVRREMA